MSRGTLTREQRLEIIRDRMTRLQWERGREAERLAEEWGVSVFTVRKDAQVVALELRRAINDDEFVAAIELGLAEVRGLAFEKGEPAAATGAYRLQLEARGLLRQKHEIRHELAGMSDQEVTAGAIAELVRDNRTREQVRAALAEWDGAHEGER